MNVKSVLWFRHGLRLHDNPSFLEAIASKGASSVTFYPIFIFDGETAGKEKRIHLVAETSSLIFNFQLIFNAFRVGITTRDFYMNR